MTKWSKHKLKRFLTARKTALSTNVVVIFNLRMINAVLNIVPELYVCHVLRLTTAKNRQGGALKVVTSLDSYFKTIDLTLNKMTTYMIFST